MKPFWQSRTFWLNVVGAVALIAEGRYGNVLSPDVAGLVLAASNVALRSLTHGGLTVK